PDLRTPDSSALCTSVAFQILREHQVPSDEEIIQHAIRYLLDTLDKAELHWRIIPESASNAPHAPWWNEEGREEERRKFSLNPTSEILGYLLDFGAADVDQNIISQIIDMVLDYLCSSKELEMHDQLCCLRLLDTKNLPESAGKTLTQEIKRLTAGAVATQPEQWKGYSLRPLQVIRHPDSPLIEGLEEAVSQNLDYEINEQNADGAWPPTWDWGDQHPETWETAKREWSGFITLDKLITLERFGRIKS
ncbi:MAG: hypothetical protein ACPG32_15415, partial [Akkermansiaceae bacterium]